MRGSKGKDGYYHTTVALPDGSRKHISARTLSELDRRRSELMAASGSGDTLGCYARRWFAAHQQNWKLKTREMYGRIIDCCICDPDIGIAHLQITDIRPAAVQGLLDRIAESGGSRTMRRTCEQVIATLRQIEQAAVRDGITVRQFTVGIDVPGRGIRQKKRALTPQEEAAVFAARLSGRDKAAAMILYGCGLRRGELIGLDVADVSIDARTISISRGVVYKGNRPVEQPSPKTFHGIRTVPIPLSVMPYVEGYVRKLEGGRWLFPGRDGGLMTLGAWRCMWARIIKAMRSAGAPCDGLTPHCFRHNYATHMYYSDITPLMGAKLMGHADTTMLNKVYAHLREEDERAAAKIDRAFPDLSRMRRVK